ncbi:MAG: C_GCAxxG_C_C family protein [Elusimicrobia bacterium]|nr:C_GCAxxG_C_C family protein [Elusimicrobiota bacterium]
MMEGSLMEREKSRIAEKARDYYLGKTGQRFNCAQAVALAFAEKGDVSPEEVRGYSAMGAGRAPDGVCGALFAAQAIARRETGRENGLLMDFFREHAGGVRCREIRRAGQFACVDCVELAAAFADRTVEGDRTE